MAELEEGNALIRREAAWVFLNMCECGCNPLATVVPGIVGNGGISAVCQNLDVDSDAESLLVMLSLLFAILDEAAARGAGPDAKLAEYVTLVEEADGFDKILALANDHDDMEIYDKAMDIISSFNPGDDEDHDDDASRDAGGPAFETAAPNTPVVAGRGGGGDDDNDDDDDDDDNMSDDSLSDDSFHNELAGTAGPITPPQQHRPPSPPPPPHQETSPAHPASLPRMPLGAVHQFPVAGGNGSENCPGTGSGNAPGGERCGEVRGDLTAATGPSQARVLGAGGGPGPGNRKMAFRESEGDKTE
eukprot:g15369.t1